MESRCPPVCAVNLGGDKGLPPPYLVTDVSVVISSLRAPGERELLGKNRDADAWNGLVDPAGEGEGVDWRGWLSHIYTTTCRIDSFWKAAVSIAEEAQLGPF